MESEVTQQKTLKKTKPELVFPTKAKEELYWTIKQLIKLLTIMIVLGIVLYMTSSFSTWLTLIFSLVGLILLLATATYCVGHFVRFVIYSAQGK